MVRRWTYWTRSYTRWIWKHLFNWWICKRPNYSSNWRKFSKWCLYNRKLQTDDKTHLSIISTIRMSLFLQDGWSFDLVDYDWSTYQSFNIYLSYFFNFSEEKITVILVWYWSEIKLIALFSDTTCTLILCASCSMILKKWTLRKATIGQWIPYLQAKLSFRE